MPAQWNHRFFMQGGGGLNGELGDAIGLLGGGAAPALAQGYAVLSQDSGHDNAVNGVPQRGGAAPFGGNRKAIAEYGGTAEQGGAAAFGREPQARADYGGASLLPVVEAAKALIGVYHGAPADHSYFFGCSKGGQEGLMLAERYPQLFDGIVAAAPGISLPRASMAAMWDTQQFANAARHAGPSVTPANLADSFSDADFALLGKAVLNACDADDAVVDGMVGNFPLCTSEKVLPALKAVTCTGAKNSSCLSTEQVQALARVHDGVRDAKGKTLYAGFPWDAGWADAGWRAWKIGSADGQWPARNLMLVAPALALVFATPPIVPAPGLDGSLAYALNFNFDRDTAKLYATTASFPRSAWDDLSARSPDLTAFSRRGGKIIVPQGVSDPIFSIDDTLQWWREVDQRAGGQAAAAVRVFPVPGMSHCGGGPSADGYDAFAALVRWVEKDEAPDRLIGQSGATTPWPGRTRPLCAYPTMPRYKGSGDINVAESFECR
jgi:feruloyl esterase